MNMKLLLVEDEYLQRNSIAILCKRLDPSIDILEAGNGQEALDQIRKSPCDAIISDIKMPGMDGLTLARLVHESWPDIQFVMLTGYGTFEYARDALRNGVTDYLLKPARFSDIEKIITKLKSNHKSINPSLPAAIDSKPDMKGIIMQACTFIQSHYADDLSLSTLSKMYHVNASYFSDQFKRYSGKSFVEYITDIRMQQACRALTANLGNITEIAASVGYSDFHYFSTVFKKRFRVSPSEYRSLHKKS